MECPGSRRGSGLEGGAEERPHVFEAPGQGLVPQRVLVQQDAQERRVAEVREDGAVHREDELLGIVRSVYQGDSYVTPGLAARLLIQARQRAKAEQTKNPLSDLTSREEQILAHASRGMTNKEIANALSLSDKTVKHYMTNIMQKLNVRNRVEAVLMVRGK